MEKTEENITKVNNHYFFEEFTFKKNKFIGHSKGEELEFADNVVWIDNFFLIFQIKERNIKDSKGFENWFKSKILRKAVQQIKKTIEYLNKYETIPIENEKGFTFDIAEAKNINPLKLIVYDPGDSFAVELRNMKFYNSKDIGNIHLLHIEDYKQICEFLITPFEIDEYLRFRELLQRANPKTLSTIPEQYILKHYFIDHTNLSIDKSYLQNNLNVLVNLPEFDISRIIKNFNKRIIDTTAEDSYYYIIKELAKMNRSDLESFKIRYSLALKKAKSQELDFPYRMISLLSECGYVFIPCLFEHKNNIKNLLRNFLDMHMYDQKLNKAIGMITYFNPIEKDHYVLWNYIYKYWEEDKEYEKIIYKNFPLREMKVERVSRYNLEQ